MAVNKCSVTLLANARRHHAPSVSHDPSLVSTRKKLRPRRSVPESTPINKEPPGTATASNAVEAMSRPAQSATSPAIAPPSILRPSLADLFLTNLRLLDLDTRHDWPGITAKTFAGKDGQQGQRNRIGCVEWALYNLFQIWDGEETRQKLQPFFPPLEPLQSLNLRAALYRSLSELRKNGVLGRESILRKTMLDECRGEKLLEILVMFSTAVLRKVQVEIDRTGANRYFSPAMKVAASPVTDTPQQSPVLPLSIAYKASLKGLLAMKAERRSRCNNFNELLNQKDQHLNERMATCGSVTDPAVNDAEEANFGRQLKTNWLGNTKWPSAVLYGDEENVGDAPLKQLFPSIWVAVADGGSLQPETNATGLLASLDNRVREQNERLKKWQVFSDEVARKVSSSHEPTMQTTASELSSIFNFTQHQPLQLPRYGSRSFAENVFANGMPPLSQPYEDVVAQMKKDLNSASRSRRRGGYGWTTRSDNKSRVPTIPQASPNSLLQLRPTRASRSPSPDPHTSSNGNVSSPPNRLIPNKPFSPSSFFSPIKHVPQPKPADSPAANGVRDISLTDVLGLNKLKLSSSPPRPIQSEPKAATPTINFPSISSNGSEMSDNNEDRPAETAAESEPVNGANLRQTNGPLSLADRTRMSMAAAGQPTPPPPPSSTAITMAKAMVESSLANDDTFDRRATLLERTRQSMAHVQDQQVKSRKSIMPKGPRQSLFPVNQFETPGKPRADASWVTTGNGARRDATPTEKLFSGEADMSSIFKSRPRIKLSPVVTPSENSFHLEPVGAGGDDASDGDIWAGVASPGSPLGLRKKRGE